MEFNNSWKTFCVANSVYCSINGTKSGAIIFSFNKAYLIIGITGLILILFWQIFKWKISIRKNQEMLEKATKVNEVLINELNHRVKNNLQIAISLLEGQAAYAEQPEIAEAINDGCNRLYVMSLAFHSIYDKELHSTIDLRSYLGNLIHYLRDEFDGRSEIILESEIDPCSMEIEQAVPLGLIISEAVSNAYKFAFKDREKGCISISLKNSGSAIILKVSDDGIGFPEPVGTEQEQAFGLNLIKGLGRQLSAIVTIENSKGVTVSLEIAQTSSSNKKCE
jgi:two-component sensor histidine kinase